MNSNLRLRTEYNSIVDAMDDLAGSLRNAESALGAALFSACAAGETDMVMRLQNVAECISRAYTPHIDEILEEAAEKRDSDIKVVEMSVVSIV